MSSLETLISRARHLLGEGHSPGQIADELSLSTETVTWLLTQQKGEAIPKDVQIDWAMVSGQGALLSDIAALLVRRYYLGEDGPADGGGGIDVIVGVALSGIPLAALIAAQESSGLAIYYPSKQSLQEKPVGSISGNFAPINNRRCVIVDDVITSGRTMQELVRYLRRNKAEPVAILVIFDKRGFRDIDGVPVYSLFKISRID